jgi:phosphoacetylglucosamine mutase
LYEDLPSKNQVIKVKDKSIFISNDNDTRLLEPVELQQYIDKISKSYSNGRCFIRASGTEDVVRIYCESKSEEETEKMAKEFYTYLNEKYS